MTEIPNLEWYSRLSQERGVGPRCPYATAGSCPRYYQSLFFLGTANNPQPPGFEDARLIKRWKSSGLWPQTDEQATGVFGKSGHPSIYANFCPEVTFERFGYFASDLTKYGDDADSGVVHRRLGIEGIPLGHPRWAWASCASQHYTDCPVYALLLQKKTGAAGKTKPWWLKYRAELVIVVAVAIIGAIAKALFG